MQNNTRSALQILAEIREGHLVTETSEHIKTAIAAVLEQGKSAVVSIELTIAPLRKGAENLTEAPLVFTGKVRSKLPEPEPESTLFFIGQDGNATRSPGDRQPGLNLSVAADTTKKTA